jgi:competence protein ComEA
MDTSRLFRRYFFLTSLLLALFAWYGPVHAQDSGGGQAAATVNINTASAAEIAAAVKGVGEKLSQAIVAYREQHGPFKTLEDVAQVKGVGPKVLEKNAGVITF